MNISEILKARGMFSKDIRIRLKNGQLQLNGEVIKEDIVITHFTTDMLEEDDTLLDEIVIDAGDFLFFNVCKNPIWIARCKIFGFENLFDSNIDNELTQMFSDFNLLKISKKELIVIKI
jgi:hypothetical protein